jgi:hypothetical protein
MNRTFESEDKRKGQLFSLWIEYLRVVHRQFGEYEFEDVYEGVATVSDLSKNRIGFCLADGRKLRNIPITPQISQRTSRLDHMYIVIGLSNGKWWPLDVISIGSIVGDCNLEGGGKGVHMTFNPEYLAGDLVVRNLH